MSVRTGMINKDKIGAAKVLIVGAGVLGNESIKSLLMSGVRRITLVDRDRIVERNLEHCWLFLAPAVRDAERPQFKVRAIADVVSVLVPAAEFVPIASNIEDLSEDFVTDFDIVLGCMDNLESRLHVNAHCYYYMVPYIDAGIDGPIGKIQSILPPGSACIECALNRTHYRALQRRYSCTGESRGVFRSPTAVDITTATVTAAIQVTEALKVLCGKHDDSGQSVTWYDGRSNALVRLHLQINRECKHHFHDH